MREIVCRIYMLALELKHSQIIAPICKTVYNDKLLQQFLIIALRTGVAIIKTLARYLHTLVTHKGYMIAGLLEYLAPDGIVLPRILRIHTMHRQQSPDHQMGLVIRAHDIAEKEKIASIHISLQHGIGLLFIAVQTRMMLREGLPDNHEHHRTFYINPSDAGILRDMSLGLDRLPELEHRSDGP